MAKFKKIAVFIVLESIALIAAYRDGLEAARINNLCVLKYGDYASQLCVEADNVSALIWVYPIFTLAAFIFLAVQIYKKWIFSKNIFLRTVFDAVAILLIIIILFFTPAILDLIFNIYA